MFTTSEDKFFCMEYYPVVECWLIIISQAIVCPVCNKFCEDIKHTLFLCEGAREIWRKIGLKEVVEEACAVDRSGCAVLDYLIAGNQMFVSII